MAYSTLRVKVSKKLDHKSVIRLKKILNRDTRVIRRCLGIIAAEYDNCFAPNKKGKMIFTSQILNEMTLTTRVRKNVRYDLKKEFPRISHNEIIECMQKALEQYESHLALKKLTNEGRNKTKQRRERNGKTKSKLNTKQLKQLKKLPKIAGFPKIRISKGNVGRNISNRRFKLDIANSTLSIIDSLDTNPKMINEGIEKIRHDYLPIPLVLHNYHVEKLTDPIVKIHSVRIIRRVDKFEVHFGLDTESPKIIPQKRKAVIGIDLGVKTDAFIGVLTDVGLSYQRSFNIDPSLKIRIGKINDKVRELQKEISRLKNKGLSHKGLTRALKQNRFTRSSLKFEANHQISSKIVDYVVQLSKKYDVYISLGDLKYLKDSTREKSRKLRRIIHAFTYYQLTQMITHKLGKYKLDKRLTLIKEFYTSKKCWKCNFSGNRPKQDHFICVNPKCGWHGHADLNGAVNIAKRLIAYRKLIPDNKRGKSGLGKYLSQLSHKPQGKSAGKSQGNLFDYFEYDQPDSVYAKRPENPASVTSPGE